MTRIPTATRWAALAAAGGLLLTACSGGGSTEPTSAAPPAAADGGQLSVALGAVPPVLDPALYSTPPNNLVNLLFSTLTTATTVDGGIEITPGVASEWTQVDDTTWEFTIPAGMSFTNGEAIDAEQMAWSIDYLRDPELGKAGGRILAATIDTVTATDAETLVVTTVGPDPLLPNRMTAAVALPPEDLQARGEEFYSDPVGSGPFTVGSFVPETSMTFVANDDPVGAAPVLDQITFTAIPEDGARVAALQSGDVDVIARVPTDQLASLEQAGITVTSYVETGTYALTVMGEQGPLADPDVRRAISLAVDRQALNDSILSGYGAPASQMAAPSLAGYCTALPELEYDPEAAADLLESAGYDGSEIVLQASSGYIANDSVLAEAITGMLSDVGLDVSLQVEEYGTFLDAYFDPALRPGMYAWRLFNRPALDAEATMTAFVQDGAVHRTVWQDDAFDAAVIASRTELDTAARDDLLCEAATILRDESPVVPLLHLPEIWGTSDAVVGFTLGLDGIPDLVATGLAE